MVSKVWTSLLQALRSRAVRSLDQSGPRSVPAREQRTRAVGLHSIHGLTEDSILAVGQYGEMWHFDGRTWRLQDSPANVALTRVRAVSRDEFVIAAMAGTVLQGQVDAWTVIDHKVTTEDFWGVSPFAGAVYCVRLRWTL